MPSKLSIAIAQARGLLPLPRLAQTLGLAAATRERKAECPFCKNATGKFSIYKDPAGRWFFRCHNSKEACVGGTNDVGHSEIAFLQLLKGWDSETAIREYIRLAEEAGNCQLYDFEAHEKRKAEPEPDPGPWVPRNPWDALHRLLILNTRDADLLRRRRGFSDHTIKSLGFRTNNRANAAHVEAVEEKYGREELLRLGLLTTFRGRTEPSVQLLGKGLTGEKDEDGEAVWDWTEPVIIPYLDADGHAFYLRPHKGGLRQERDEFDEAFTSSHVYCPYLLSQFEAGFDGTVILTEGEFKAAAAWQAGVACIAIPGITFGGNRAFRKELVTLLQQMGATQVVVMFDNEVKDDPRFKERFKADPYDREDTLVWALFTAKDLRDEFESVTVGMLPDEWRIEGKADIDGALAGFVHGVPGHAVFDLKNGLEEGTLLLRRGLRRAIDAAERPEAFLKRLPAARRNIIRNRLERKWNPPELRSGGDAEEKLARRFMRLDCEGNPIDEEMARAYRKVAGCYYGRRRPAKDDAKLYSIQIQSLDRQIAVHGAIPAAEQVSEDEIEGVEGLSKEERAQFGPTLTELKDRRAALYERIRGFPEAVTDCTLRCDYKKHDADGNVVRLVRIRSCRTSKWSERLFELPASASCAPKNFREWGHQTGICNWKGDQGQLDTLVQDLDNSVEGRNIFEVNAYGYHKLSWLWFFGDCAFPPAGGPPLEADASNIIWHEGIGYQVDPSVDERGTSFEQKAPMMLAPQETRPNAACTAADMLHRMTGDFYTVVGDYDAWLLIGALAAYAIAPELLRLYGGHPGAWLHGVRGGGKTTIARWGMRLWGFGHLDGIAIDDRTTPVGMNRALAQYSCLPVWFEEYRHSTVTPQKEAVLRGAFDRNSGAKGMPDGSNRTKSAKIFTTPIVTGESSSSDAATRSRYTLFNISKSRRLEMAAARYSAIQEDCKHYYLIGRFLLENRASFWTKCEPLLREWWENDEKVKEKIPDERVRYVYSVARAAFCALCEMLEVRQDEIAQYFDAACLRYGELALHDVVDETFVNQFWGDVVSGLRNGDIDLDLFEEAVVRIKEDGSLARTSGAESGSDWHEILFVAPKSVFDQYSMYLRKQGRNPVNDYLDMRKDLCRESYFIPPPQNSTRAHSARIKKATTKVWALFSDPDDPNCFPYALEIREMIANRRKHDSDSSGVNGVA